MPDRFSDTVDSIVTWVAVTVLGGIATGTGWLIRRVFTNQKQIELLQADLLHRERQRNEDRERIEKIERGVERIEDWIVTRKDR